MKSLALTIGLAAVLSLSAIANAGQTAAVSSLAALPAASPIRHASPGKVAGLTLTSSDIGRNKETKWHELTANANQGFCINDHEAGMRWSNSIGASEKTPASDFELLHLADKDGKTTLERTNVHFDSPGGTIAPTGRAQVELTEVARTQNGEVVVFAYRDGSNIVLLARGAESGTESRTLAGDSGMVAFVSADGCNFSGVRLDARKPEGGTVAQMAVVVKVDAKNSRRFLVDASLSKVARDPEPKLAVRIRAFPTS